MAQYLYGPLTRLGLIAAAIVCALDQAVKLWLMFSFDLASKGLVHLTSFLAFVLTWNPGISYGLFPQDTDFGRYTLLALKTGAVVILWVWLARAESRLTALAPYQSLFLAAAALALGAAFRLNYRKPADCQPGSLCERPATGWITRAILWAGLALAISAAAIDLYARLIA